MNAGLVAQVVKKWKEQASPYVRRPATVDEVEEFQRSHRIDLPLEMRELYLAADGFDQHGNSYDANGFNFFPLRDVHSASDARNGGFSFSGADSCYVFCEYLAWSWGYGIVLEKTNPSNDVVIVGGAGDTCKRVTSSFRQFLEIYLMDDERLYISKD